MIDLLYLTQTYYLTLALLELYLLFLEKVFQGIISRNAMIFFFVVVNFSIYGPNHTNSPELIISFVFKLLTIENSNFSINLLIQIKIQLKREEYFFFVLFKFSNWILMKYCPYWFFVEYIFGKKKKKSFQFHFFPLSFVQIKHRPLVSSIFITLIFFFFFYSKALHTNFLHPPTAIRIYVFTPEKCARVSKYTLIICRAIRTWLAGWRGGNKSNANPNRT